MPCRALPGAFGLALACLLATACDRPGAPTSDPAGAGDAVAAPTAAQAAPTNAETGSNAMTQDTAQSNAPGPLASALKQDMAYGDLRKAVLAQGFAPVVDPQCRAQVVGGDEKTCAANPDLAICKACGEIPELSGYTGDGYARTRFASAQTGQTLEVVSYGMIEDWNVGDADSRLRVTEWKFAGP